MHLHRVRLQEETTPRRRHSIACGQLPPRKQCKLPCLRVLRQLRIRLRCHCFASNDECGVVAAFREGSPSVRSRSLTKINGGFFCMLSVRARALRHEWIMQTTEKERRMLGLTLINDRTALWIRQQAPAEDNLVQIKKWDRAGRGMRMTDYY